MAFMSTMVPPSSSPFMRAVECIEPAGRTGEGKRTLSTMISTRSSTLSGVDEHLGMVGPGPVPGLDGDVLLDLHELPPAPGRQTIKQTTGESRLQAARDGP